jgi:hypothetical protein
VILRALRTTTTGVPEARRLAGVLAEEAALVTSRAALAFRTSRDGPASGIP